MKKLALVALLFSVTAHAGTYVSLDANGSYVALGIESYQLYNNFGVFGKVGNATDGRTFSLGTNYSLTSNWAVYSGLSIQEYVKNTFTGYEYYTKSINGREATLRRATYDHYEETKVGADLGIKYVQDYYTLGVGYNSAAQEVYASVGVSF